MSEPKQGIVTLNADDEIHRRSQIVKEFAAACPDIATYLCGKSFEVFCHTIRPILEGVGFIFLNELYEVINE